jgi:hypothetical protein
MIDLDAIESAAKAATPGPWSAMRWSGNAWPDAHISVGADEHGSRMAIAMNTRYAKRPEEDMNYISTMNPTTTLALVEEVRRLREYHEANVEHARDALKDEEQIGPAPLLHFARSVIERDRLLKGPSE